MDKLELLYDHFKDTYINITTKIKQRDRVFVITFILLLVQALLVANPYEYEDLLITYVKEQYSIDLSNQIMALQTFIWIALIYFSLRYSQACVYLERTYIYISSLESKISSIVNTNFDRESVNYLKSYPFISKVTNFIYKYIFAIIAIIIPISKIISEFIDFANNKNLLTISDVGLLLFYEVIWISHIAFMLKKDK